MDEHEEYVIKQQLLQIQDKLGYHARCLEDISKGISWVCGWLFLILIASIIASISSFSYLDDIRTNTAPQQQEESVDNE